MAARSPATTQAGPKGPTPAPAKTSPKSVPAETETQVPVVDEGAGGPQVAHARLLDGSKLGAVGDGQQIRLFQALQRTYGNAHAASIVAQLEASGNGLRRPSPNGGPLFNAPSARAAAQNGGGAATLAPSVQRQPAAACPAPPAPPRPAAPQQDPRFKAVGIEVRQDAASQKRHDPPGKKVAEAQGAAKPPADDVDSQAKAAKTEKMATAKPGTFDKAAFMAAVRQAIAAKAPKNLDEADKFAHSDNADVKSEVTGKVNQGKEGATKDVKQKAEEPPDPSKAKPKEVKPDVPETPGPRPADPPAAAAMPQPAPPGQKDLGAGKCETDSQMKEAGVTDEQLAKSNEPEFTGALEAKKEGEQHSAQAPAQVAQKEKAELEAAKKDAAGDAKAAVTQMHGARQGATGKVGAGKSTAKAKDEAERAKVSGEVKAIYDRAEKDVKGILDGLDKKVDSAFDQGEAAAKRAFTERHESEMKAYKDRRYSGLLGKGRWLKDKFAGLPEEANQIYVRARDQVYLPKMDQVISNVADIVGGELTKAKQRVEQGRGEIKKYVAGLPASLKRFGAEAQKGFSSKFDELEKSVDDKQKELVDKLATRYVEARNKVDDEIKSMQEANKGLWDKVKNAVAGVIKTILELKNMLMNVLAKAASVIGKIIKDPIGFLGNLIAGIKGGLMAFLGKIGDHMKKGVVGWLLGAMQSAGLELPDKFDIKGIIKLVASLLGLTWAAIRGRVVSRGVPDQAVTAAEKAVPEAEAIKNEGIGGLWQRIKAKIGDVKEMILGKLKDFLIPTVITAGIMWVISLLNPASAFVKAVKAIIDIVKFVFERGAQLVEFVNTVLDAIITIAGGAIGGAVHAIEGALAKSIPVLIGFLAAILGIGGLADKVKSIFQALTKPIMKVVDWVVDKIVKLAKKLWAKIKGAFGKKKKGKTKEDEKDDRQHGLARPKVDVPFALSGASHRLTFVPEGDDVKVLMASWSPLPLTDQFRRAHVAIDNFKHYVGSIKDPKVKQDFETKLLAKVEAFHAPEVAAFKAVYKDVFPSKSQERTLSGPAEQSAADRVRPLVARAEAMLAELKSWGAATGIEDLSEAKIDQTLWNEGHRLWKEVFLEMRGRIATIVGGFSYKGAPVQFLGSMKSGWRGPHKGRTHFDAKEFDVDMYVVHPGEFRAVRERQPEAVDRDKIFAEDALVFAPKLFYLSQQVGKALAAAFPGVKGIEDSEIVLRDKPPS